MSMERSSEIDRVAADWLARRDSSGWTDDDQRRLEQWLDESLLHRVAYLRLEHVWERSERLAVLGAGTRSEVAPAVQSWSPAEEEQEGDVGPRNVAVRASRRWVRALAAGVLIVTALATSYYLWPTGSHYRTPVGGLASVPMSDGSKITLNTDSRIRVAVDARERRVELERGEAFFDVAKDPTRPFFVRAGNKRVIAVGTKFSVRRDAAGIQVIVTEGKVLIETEGSGSPDSAEPLPAGTIVQASDSGLLLQTRPLAQVEESLSWRQGVLVLHQMTLAEASAEFNRYNIRKIVIEDPAVGELRVAGSFRANNVDGFVRLIERGYSLRSEVRGDQVILRSR